MPKWMLVTFIVILLILFLFFAILRIGRDMFEKKHKRLQHCYLKVLKLRT
ncbi:hypothetical protein J7E81_04600 [Bacillus sp. ISL-18]|nr:hypothetical protein [Bacillus sp. ISL-18]MBT2654524.1 hypothetical protein [Bacillus sp. ISL-18]